MIDQFAIKIKTVFIFFVLFFVSNFLITKTLKTNKLDYLPGETVVITGYGFLPYETVEIYITHIEPNLPNPIHYHEPWFVYANENGHISTSWYVNNEELNTTLLLSAAGQTSGFCAETIFTDGDHDGFVSATISASATELCTGYSAILSLNVTTCRHTSGPGFTIYTADYLWQQSADNSSWSTASGTATNSTYTATPSSNTYYRCLITITGTYQGCGVTVGSTYTTASQYIQVSNVPFVNFTTASQSSANESGSLTITAELSCSYSSTVTIPFSVNSSSSADGSDYSISSSPITITTGNTSGNITISIVSDSYYEPDETVIVDMGTPTNAVLGSIISHTATITNDDPAGSGTLIASPSSICLGETINFTATNSWGCSYIKYYQISTDGVNFWDIINPASGSCYESYTPTWASTFYFRYYWERNNGNKGYVYCAPVVVSSVSVGGGVYNGNTPICIGSSTGTMSVSGHNGSVVRWEKSLNSGTWSTISNTSTSYSENPASAGTWQYRAVIVNGACSEAYSTPFTVVVNPPATITLGSFPVVCEHTTSAQQPYSAKSSNAEYWSIVFDATAISAGFSSPQNGSLSSAPGNFTIQVPWGAAIGTYNGTLTVGSYYPSCAGNSYSISVSVSGSGPNTPGAISGNTTQCPATAGEIYSISAVPTATTYTWTVPTGWSITAGAGTNSITVTTGSFGQNGDITVTAGNTCGTSASSSLPVTISPPVTINAFSPATSTRCQGVGTVTTTTTANNSTGITYSLDAASISGGNTIVAATGAVTYAAGWSGTTTITASAAGCNGPATTDHVVTITPTVTINAFSPATSTRCQGAGTVTTTTTANNTTGITYSLDAASISGGNTIVAATGAVTYAAGWSGTTTITASAAGCNGPATTTHVVTITPTVTINAFSPATSTRCQGAGTVTTTTTANNTTGITYSLDAASISGGNTIVAATGAVTYAAGWSGTTTITASAAGCNGPATTTHVVTINANPIANPSSNSPLCIGEDLNLMGAPNGMSYYSWIGPNSFTSNLQNPSITSVSAADAGSYALTVTNSNGCTSVSSITNVLVYSITATISAITSDWECPELIPAQGFMPDNDAPYNAGTTKLIFRVTRGSSTSAWSFSYTVSGGSVNVSYFPNNPASATVNVNAGDNFIDMIFFVNNTPGSAQSIVFEITSVNDTDHSCSTNYALGSNTQTINISAMPAVGPYSP